MERQPATSVNRFTNAAEATRPVILARSLWRPSPLPISLPFVNVADGGTARDMETFEVNWRALKSPSRAGRIQELTLYDDTAGYSTSSVVMLVGAPLLYPIRFVARAIGKGGETRVVQRSTPMKLIQAYVFVFCLLAAAPSVSLAADAKGDVEKAYAAWDAAFNKQDAKALAANYVSTAKLLPPTHQVASGPAEIEKFWAGLFVGGVTGHKLEMIDAGGDDKVVFGTAKWSATGKDKDGKPSPLSGLAMHVFERQADGSLKLSLQTFN